MYSLIYIGLMEQTNILRIDNITYKIRQGKEFMRG